MISRTIALIWVLVGLLGASNLRADLGLPQIQAVCRITLVDGTKHEGFIVLSKGTYYYYRPHGFCFIHGKGVYGLRPFSLEFKPFSPRQIGSYKSGESRLYYAASMVNSKPKIEYDFDEEHSLLTRSCSEINQYELAEKIILYSNLPLSLYLPDKPADEDSVLAVDISEIDRFEFLAYPSESWLEIIETARQRLQKEMIELEKKGDVWVDYLPPDWYHEILTDDERYGYLRQYFK